RPRNSLGVPVFQPLAASFLRLLSRIVVLLQTPTANLQYRLRRLRGFLGKDLRDYDCIGVDAIYQPPFARHIIDPQFMAAWHDTGHGSRLRHGEQVSPLEPP